MWSAAILSVAWGCIEGPFAHANPLDASAALALRIAGPADTLRAVGQVVVFQLVTDPPTLGLVPAWRSSNPALLAAVGHGRFTVTTPPVVTTSVTITAILGEHSATHAVILAPPP